MALDTPNPDGATPNTVILRGMDELEYKNDPADGDIRPGMLVERTANGVAPHGTAAGTAAPFFAVEWRKVGMLADEVGFPEELTSSTAINSVIESGNLVKFAGFDKGHQVWGLVPDGVNVPAYTPLVSNGDGTLRPINTGGATGEDDGSAVVQSIEAVDNTAGGEPARVRMEIIS